MEIVNKLSYERLNKPAIENTEREKQEFKLIDTISRTRGLGLFSFNPHTGKIIEIKTSVEKTVILEFVDGEMRPKDYSKERVVIDPRNIYFEALNINSAKKRVEKYLNGRVKELSNLKHYNGTITFF